MNQLKDSFTIWNFVHPAVIGCQTFSAESVVKIEVAQIFFYPMVSMREKTSKSSPKFVLTIDFNGAENWCKSQ